MTRTEILCPNCMKKKLLDTGDRYPLITPGSDGLKTAPLLRCDECGTEFVQTGHKTVQYAEK